jgi:hypothetical protein
MTAADPRDDHFEHLRLTVDSIHHLARDQRNHSSEIASYLEKTHRALRSQIEDVASEHKNLAREVGEMRTELSEFSKRSGRDMRLLIAHSRLADVHRQLEQRFGHHERVRRAVRGVIWTSDHGLVHDATPEWVAENLLIDVPSYWLATMLAATVAWFRHDEPAAQKALDQALAAEPGKSSLYAALLTARFRQYPASEKWLQRYLAAQEPRQLPEDFVVVLDAAVTGSLGPSGRRHITDRCHMWYEDLRANPALVRREVDRWRRALADYAQRAKQQIRDFKRDNPALTEHSADWRPLAESMRLAAAFEKLRALFEQRPEMAGSAAGEHVQRADAMLRKLTSVGEPAEQRLRLQIKSLEGIVRRGEDSDDTAEIPIEADPDDVRPDFLTMLSTIALNPEAFPTTRPSPDSIQLATALCRDWAATAVDEVAAELAATIDRAVPVVIAGWRGEISSRASVDDLATSLVASIDRDIKDDEEREQLTPWRKALFLFAGFGVLAFGYSWLTAGRFAAPAPMIAFIAFAAAFTAGVFLHMHTPIRLARVRNRGDHRRARGVANLHQAILEHHLLLEQWDECRAQATATAEYFRRLETPRIKEDDLDAAVPGPALDDVTGRFQPAISLPDWRFEPGNR